MPRILWKSNMDTETLEAQPYSLYSREPDTSLLSPVSSMVLYEWIIHIPPLSYLTYDLNKIYVQKDFVKSVILLT